MPVPCSKQWGNSVRFGVWATEQGLGLCLSTLTWDPRVICPREGMTTGQEEDGICAECLWDHHQ